MKTTATALSLLVAINSGPVMAQTVCGTDTVSGHSSYVPLTSPTDVTNLLVGNTACYWAGGATWENQEYLSGGTITDFKLGSNPKDPTGPVGNYSIASNGVITYSYTVGNPFSYVIWGASTSGLGNYDFCNDVTGVFLPNPVTIISGGPTSCGAVP